MVDLKEKEAIYNMLPDGEDYADQLNGGPSVEHEDRQDTAMQAMKGMEATGGNA